MRKKIFFFTLSLFFFSFTIASYSNDQTKLGFIEKKGNDYKISFEFGKSVDWQKDKWVLSNEQEKTIFTVLFRSPAIKSGEERSQEEKRIEETDLGGSSKKKAPLAYKNPRVKSIKIARSENPFKKNGIQLLKTTQETDSKGDPITTSVYADGSKSIVRISKKSKEESSYNKKGILVWHHLEGQEEELKYTITKWEDGSIIREYTKPEGSLSVVFDTEKKDLVLSFLNSERETLKEITCTEQECKF